MRPNTWISTKADGFSGSSKAPSTTVFGRKSPGTDVHMCIGRMTPADSAHIQSKLGYEWMTSLTCSLLVPFPPYVSSFSSLLWGGPDVKVGKEPNTLSKTICAIKNHKIPQRLLIKCPTSWREIKLQEAMLKERGIRIIANQDNKKDTSSISVIGSAFLFFSFLLSCRGQQFLLVTLLLSLLNTLIHCKTQKDLQMHLSWTEGICFVGSNGWSLFSHKWAWEFEFDVWRECQQVSSLFPVWKSSWSCRHMYT